MANLKPARILAIETSCDETAAAVLENGRVLLASTVASQMEIHARYGGVYPEVAARQHVLSILPVIEQTLAQAHLAFSDINAIAATRGPGLAGSLVVEPVDSPELPVRITLCAALVKFDRFEWTIEKATELGVERILPVETARGEKGLLEASRKRCQRWERIARESS